MSGVASLANAAINLSALREGIRRDLIAVLDSMRGNKVLVLDPALIGPMGLIAEVSLLKERGVENIYRLTPELAETDARNVLYLVRPRMALAKQVAAHIQRCNAASAAAARPAAGGRGAPAAASVPPSDGNRSYSVYFVPRKTLICEKVLEEEGVYGDVVIGEFMLDLIPMDEDLLSMEWDSAYRECFLDGDRSSLYYVARSIMKLQSLFGLIPIVRGKGTCAKHVWEMMNRMRQELGPEVLGAPSEIDSIILIDREADLLTPMMTQLTYEGLIDELFGIKDGLLEPDFDVGASTPPPGMPGQPAPAPPPKPAGPPRKVKIPLNSNDRVFSEIRHQSFTAVGGMLNKRALYLDEGFKERHSVQTVSQIREFMKKLPNLQEEHKCLATHINIAERINKCTMESGFRKCVETEHSIVVGGDEEEICNYIEECINKQEPLSKVLRLLCMFSLSQGGLKTKQFDFFRREILQSYGYEVMLTLGNLEKVGLLKHQESRASFPAVRKSLRLVVDEVDEATPTDAAYTYSGYCPTSIRLVEAAQKMGGWRTVEDALRAIPGPYFEETQKVPGASSSGGAAAAASSSSGSPKVTVVFFIGGATFSEISALRWLSQREDDGQREYIIATTKLMNGTSLLESLYEKVGSLAPQ